MRIAALNGAGIAQLLRIAVTDDLAAGRLVEIMAHAPLAPVPVQALHAFGRFAPLRLPVFTAFLAETLAPHLLYPRQAPFRQPIRRGMQDPQGFSALPTPRPDPALRTPA